MRGTLYLVPIAMIAGCGDDPTTTITCGTGTEGVVTADAPISVTASNGADLRGAAIAAGTGTTIPATAVKISCASDINPAGTIALGPAVTFGSDGTWSDRPFLLTLPYKSARLPKDAGRKHVRIVARRANQPDAFFPLVANKQFVDDDAYASRVTFKAGELTTYQVVADEDAGKPVTRQFGWRAITGISMGGNAAMTIGLRHPDKFDTIADLGGEPGPSMVYTLGMVRDLLFGGFCTAEDEAAGRGNVGQLCPKQPLAGQFEIGADFEHMIHQDGDGVGLTLRRSLYMKGMRDMARAMGNPALYSLDNPYSPPGVDFDFFQVPAATRCANPTKLDNFFDREFNPDGMKPVITFCDGNDGPALGNAVWDPNVVAMDPAELLLAVDLNNNGKRDQGEPVITNAMEPFDDVGTDGVADAQEPGYDAMTNPDPAGDNYHSIRNPLGTEGNGNREEGEHFMDVGLDGVAGTCQATEGGNCYDFGEGDGQWTISPNVTRWYDNDLLVRLAALTDEQRDHVSLWFDAGIRDFLNNSVSTNAAVGQTAARYPNIPFGVYDNFSILDGGVSDASYDFLDVKWDELPKNGYLRYGNPDATPAQIDNGDGRHVGTANQIIYRVQTAFGWINRRWPEGDYAEVYDSGQILRDLTFTSPTTGRVNPFGLFLPPGYNKPENAEKRYPVVFFLHGYGQEPKDLVDLSSVFALNMLGSNPEETRFQKFIIVYVDGRCRPNKDGTPVDLSGDRCEGGTFYLDSPLGGPAQMETNLLELGDYIDANYRTKMPSTASVTD